MSSARIYLMAICLAFVVAACTCKLVTTHDIYLHLPDTGVDSGVDIQGILDAGARWDDEL